MSTVMSSANVLVNWRRSTAYVLDSRAPAGTMAASRAPVRAACVQVALTGTPTGTVTVSGLVGGVADSEVLTWTGTPGTKATIKQFTTLAFTSSLTGAVLIEATAVGLDGAPQAGNYTLKAGHPVQLAEPGRNRWPGQIPGHERTADRICRVQYEEVWTPREGDLVDVVTPATGETFQVSGVPTVQSVGMAPDHWRCDLVQAQGA